MIKSLESIAQQKRHSVHQKTDAPNPDPLGDVFHLLTMKSVFYTHSELTSPWGMEMPAIPQSLMFHIVVQGHCYVMVKGQTTQLSKGDFLMVPHGLGHHIFDHASSYCAPLFDLPIEQLTKHYEILRYGGKGEKTVLLCGAVSFEHPIASRLLALMPQFVQIDSDHHQYNQTIKNTMNMLATEAKCTGVGSEAVITRLADIIVIQSLRAWLDTLDTDNNGWLAALHDKRLSKAIICIHNQPEKSWTVGQLATEAGMSRTSFAEHFKRMVGESPLQYLTQWRMALATSQLIHSKESILEVALNLGYQSEAAFSRAYKKVVGVTPSTTRRS